MRRGIWARAAVCILALALVVAACGDDEAEPTTTVASSTEATDTTAAGTGELTGTLIFFAYEDSYLPEVLDPFREAHPNLVIETPAFGDEDETETKLRAGFQADVVEMCAGEVGDMVTGGLLMPIDTSRIDDWDLLLPVFLGGKGTVDDAGNVYMVPLQGGASGILYDVDALPEGIESYEELFFGDYEGAIAVSQNPVNTIGDMLLALGYGPDIFEVSDEVVTEAVDALIEAKRSGRIRAYFESDTELFNLLATGEVVASAHGFSSLVARLADEGVNAEYVAPLEGELTWNCGHGISANAQNLDAAYALINHYLLPDSQIAFAEIEEYLASNARTLEEGDQEIVESAGLRAAAEAYHGAITEGDPDNREWWDDEWRRFLTS